MMLEGFSITQSLPICCALAAVGGLLEVGATAVTAIPAVRENQGRPVSHATYWLLLLGNLSLQAVGSLLSHLFATWYGPISVVVPFFYSATLLSNILIFGVLLGTEFFSKTMRVGTYVIVVAVILLPVVGPKAQDDQDIIYLFHKWYTIAWFTLLLCATAVTGYLLVTGIDKFSTRSRFWILLTARAASVSVNLTVSRSFILSPSHLMWICFLILKVTSGAVYTYAIIVQAAVVDQARFVPLNTTTIILVNAATGCLIWEDWKVIQSWHGYACVFVLLGLGCDLLLTVPLLHDDFGTSRQASLFMQHRAANRKKQRQEGYHAVPDTPTSMSALFGTKDHYDLSLEEKDDTVQEEMEDDDDDELGGVLGRPLSAMSRRDAWKNVIMPPRERTSTI